MAILALFFALIVFALARNEATYRARIAILRTSTPEDEFAGNALHDLLPYYDSMMWHPSFWHMWTSAQWREWIATSTAGREAR